VLSFLWLLNKREVMRMDEKEKKKERLEQAFWIIWAALLILMLTLLFW